MSAEVSAALEVCVKRREVLHRIADGSVEKPDLVDSLECSRATVDRAIRELERAGLVERSGGVTNLTVTGRLLYARYVAFEDDCASIVAVSPFLPQLRDEMPPLEEGLYEADVVLAEPPCPHQPIRRLEELLSDCSSARAFTPVLIPQYVTLASEHAATNDRSIEFFTDTGVIEALTDEQVTALSTDGCRVWEVATDRTLSLWMIDESAVWIGVHGDSGTLDGALIATADEFRSWANELFAEFRSTGTPVVWKSE